MADWCWQWVSHMAFIMFRYVPSNPTLLRVFVLNGCWIVSVHSFLSIVIFCTKIYHSYQFLYWTTFRCYQYFAVTDSTVMNILMYSLVYLWERFLEYLENVEVEFVVACNGRYASSVLPKTDKFLSRALIPNPASCVRLPISPYNHWYVLLSDIQILY